VENLPYFLHIFDVKTELMIISVNSRFNWHTDGELFGLLKPDAPKTQEQRLRAGVEDYDISQLEILGDGVEEQNSFKGSLKA